MAGVRMKGDSSLNPYERAYCDRFDLPIGPLLDGIDGYQSALKAHRAIHEFGGPKEHKEYIAECLQQYSD